MPCSRRTFIAAVPAVVVSGGISGPRAVAGEKLPPHSASDGIGGDHSHFPHQDPNLVKEMVTVSHFDVGRAKELVGQSPALAKASWDWGFGDWESALGAASHMGQYELASFLIENGARPNIFTFAMMGRLDATKALIEAIPGLQRSHGPHGITLLEHARKGGARAAKVVEYLESLGDADLGHQSKPLTDTQKEAYIGTYGFGPGPEDSVIVARNRRNGSLQIKRGPSGAFRELFYLGGHEFHPAGAEAVRIRFSLGQDRADDVTVLDPTPILTAKRNPA